MNKNLKKVPTGKKGKGLKKLPRKVRNKMGFMKKGGKVRLWLVKVFMLTFTLNVNVAAR